MDIPETWKKLEKERLERHIEGGLQHSKDSCHPVAKLKKNYFMKTVMMAVFIICFSALLFYFNQLMIRVAIGVLVFAYMIFLLASYSMYKNIRADLLMDGSLLEVLTSTKEQISRALRFETITSLLVSPVAGAAGYFMGYTVSGRSIEMIFASSTQVAMFIGTIIVFTVLGYFLGRRLTREGYGKAVEEIGGMMRELGNRTRN
jgi:hypothetical protein